MALRAYTFPALPRAGRLVTGISWLCMRTAWPVVVKVGRARHASAGASSTSVRPRFLRIRGRDVAFVITVAFIGVPFLGVMYANTIVRVQLDPYFRSAKRQIELAAPDVWLAIERLSGREGEYSEPLRRSTCARYGVAYEPRVAAPPPSWAGGEGAVAAHPASAVAAVRMPAVVSNAGGASSPPRTPVQ